MFMNNGCCVICGHSIVMGLGSFRDLPVWPLINFRKEEALFISWCQVYTLNWGFPDAVSSLLSQGILKAKNTKLYSVYEQSKLLFTEAEIALLLKLYKTRQLQKLTLSSP